MPGSMQSLNHPITPPPNGFAIQATNLRKDFGSKLAVRDLTLQVPRGEVFGFIGPNGAGKSTSIKMFVGLVSPTEGQATVLGAPAGNVEARRKIGFLPEHFRFYDWLTPAELLRLHGRLYGMSPAQLRERVPAYLELVGLTPHQDKQLHDFSKGMLQRIGLAQALINEPDLIFLDEPTSGLDPIGRRLVRDIIKGQRERGAAIFLNSHLLSEVEITCDRVAFIKHGEVLQTHDLKDLAQGGTEVTVRARHLAPEISQGLDRWATGIRSEGEVLTLSVPSADVVPEIVRHLVAGGADVYEVTPQKLSLEDMFLNIVGEDGGL